VPPFTFNAFSSDNWRKIVGCVVGVVGFSVGRGIFFGKPANSQG